MLSSLSEHWLWRCIVGQIWLSWRFFRLIHMSGGRIIHFGRCETVSSTQVYYPSGFILRESHVLQKMLKMLTMHGIPWLELWHHHAGIWIYLVSVWNGPALMDSTNIVALLWLPRSGIIRNMSGVLNSHMAHVQYLNVYTVHPLGIQIFDYTTTQGISMFP